MGAWEIVKQLFGWASSQFANGNLWDEVLAAVVFGIVVVLWNRLINLFRAILRRITHFFGARRALRQLDREITRTRLSGRWSRKVSPADKRLQRKVSKSKPVILVANQKGGVGKTTLAENLGCYFAIKHNKRVLFVDLDFQGTMSATLRSMSQVRSREETGVERIFLMDFARRRYGFPTPCEELISSRKTLSQRDLQGRKGDLAYSSFFDAGPELADLEDWLMLKWVARRDRLDARFQLARFLHSDEVQGSKEVDIIILDSPPRDTTAGVNGFCACTDIIVPTRADLFSWEGARRFIENVSIEHELLAPHARIRGFVGTMTRKQYPPDEVPAPLDEAIAALRESTITDPKTKVEKPILGYWPAGSALDYFGTLPSSEIVASDAGREITYLSNRAFRDQVDVIGDRLFKVWFPEEASVDSAESCEGG